MNQENVNSIVRHILTFVGGIFILKGWVEEGMVQELIGALSTVVGVFWSLFRNKQIEAKLNK